MAVLIKFGRIEVGVGVDEGVHGEKNVAGLGLHCYDFTFASEVL